VLTEYTWRVAGLYRNVPGIFCAFKKAKDIPSLDHLASPPGNPGRKPYFSNQNAEPAWLTLRALDLSRPSQTLYNSGFE
jgi:hypothetical protein